MFRLAHISDVHLGPLPPVHPASLMSKRMTGYINWHRHRKNPGASGRLDRLVADLKSGKPDHIAVTGDLVNIGLPAEIVNARLWLESLGGPNDVTVVPGNHDAYVRSSIDCYMKEWLPFMRGDGKTGAQPAVATFPFLRRCGPVLLVAVSTAIATPLFMATGRIGQIQLQALAGHLRAARDGGLLPVVLMHHPPLPKTGWRRSRRLLDATAFRAVIAAEGAGLVLHGHDHVRSLSMIAGRGGQVPVIGVPAANAFAETVEGHETFKLAGYAIHEIAPVETGFRVTTVHRGTVDGSTFQEFERHTFQIAIGGAESAQPTATQA